MIDIEQVRKGLSDRKLTVVAEATGLHYQTVWRISTGRGKNPSYAVVKKLARYLEGENNG